MTHNTILPRLTIIEQLAHESARYKPGDKLRGRDAKGEFHLYLRPGKGNAIQRIWNRFADRPKMLKAIEREIAELMKDHEVWSDPDVRASALEIKAQLARKLHDVRLGNVKHHAVSIETKRRAIHAKARERELLATQRRKAREAQLDKDLVEIFTGDDSPDASDRLEDFARFARPTSQWQAGTRNNLEKLLGMQPGDPCVESLQHYVQANMAAAGKTVMPEDVAHLAEFARRWNMAKLREPKPGEFFGWGKAVGRLVEALASGLDVASAHEPSIALVPSAMRSEAFREAGAALADALVNGSSDKLNQLATKLGAAVAAALARTPKAVQMAFVASQGQRFMRELKEVLLEQSAMATLREGMTLEQRDALAGCLRTVYDSAVRAVPDRIIDFDKAWDANAVTHVVKVKEFVLDGVTYKNPKYLTTGGYGDVYLFTADSGLQMILKTPVITPTKKAGELFKEGAVEVRSHSVAMTLDNSNIIGLKGVLRLGDGLAIAVKYADGGSLFDAIPKIHAALARKGDGAISPVDAKLIMKTLARDITLGLEQLQSSRISHLDLKSPNVLIDGGVAKIGDFGTAREGSERKITSIPVDNPDYRDAVMKEKQREFQDKFDELFALTREVTEHAKNQGPAAAEARKDELRAIVASEKMAHEQRLAALESVSFNGRGGDLWSCGVTLYHLLSGKLPPFVDAHGMASVTEELQNAYLKKNGQARNQDLFGAGPGASIDEDMQKLIGSWLDPDPDLRMESAAALQTYFNPADPQNAEVGSDRIRKMIAEITTA